MYRGTPSTPTPTPQKFAIKGVVYNDKNSNGVVDGNDTVFDGTKPGSPFITTSEFFSGSFIGSYSLDQGGFYITSRIYQSGSFYKVLLNNVPQGCSSNRNPHNIQMPNNDATENFPLSCAIPTGPPTPTPTPTLVIL